MSHQRPVQVIAVTGGKGGVGKTNIAVNLAVSLAEMQREVVLFDADFGLANIDVLLGVKVGRTLADFLAGRCTFSELVITGPKGVRIVPGASGVQHMADLTVHQHSVLINAFSQLDQKMDVLIVDTAAGISDSVIQFVRAAQQTLVVVCDEPSSITDAYALIKVLNKDYGQSHFRVLANMTRHPQEGAQLYNKLQRVCDRFLDITLEYAGFIPFDEEFRHAVKKQQPIVLSAPHTRAAQCIRNLASQVTQWPLPSAPRGHLEFFMESLLLSPTVKG